MTLQHRFEWFESKHWNSSKIDSYVVMIQSSSNYPRLFSNSQIYEPTEFNSYSFCNRFFPTRENRSAESGNGVLLRQNEEFCTIFDEYYL